jgi:hypothetical protein
VSKVATSTVCGIPKKHISIKNFKKNFKKKISKKKFLIFIFYFLVPQLCVWGASWNQCINELDENVLQNPHILCRTHGLFPEQSTPVPNIFFKPNKNRIFLWGSRFAKFRKAQFRTMKSSGNNCNEAFWPYVHDILVTHFIGSVTRQTV